MSSLIGSALLAALILSFICWIAALQADNRRKARARDLDARNDAIDAHYQRNLKRYNDGGHVNTTFYGNVTDG